MADDLIPGGGARESPPRVDASVSVQIARGAMVAQLMVSPPQNGGREVSVANMEAALAAAGVTHGVDASKLDDLARAPEYGIWVEVARAIPSVPGEPAQFNFKFPLEHTLQPKVHPDGRVDYFDLEIVASVRAGDILCERIPPTPGIPGTTVNGNPVPAKAGRDRPLPVGKNTAASPDGLLLRATAAGQPNYDRRTVSVLPIFEVTEDVGVATGNVAFVGNVIVKGNVTAGFKVESDGDIDVHGVVEGGTLTARGSVSVRMGMKNRSVVRAEGNVTTRFVESSTLHCGGNVIAESLIHSSVSCRGDITLSGGKGIILGGHVLAGRSVSARTIGSASAAALLIEISPDPTLLQRERQLKQELVGIDAEIGKLERLNLLFGQYVQAGRLTDDKRDQMLSVRATYRAMTAQKAGIEEELAVIAGQLTWNDRGFIQCSERLYRGTRIQMGKSVEIVVRDIDHCRFVCRDGAISSTTY